MINFIKWFFSPSKKELTCDESYIYDRILNLEDRVRVLEEENVAQSNALYECWNSLDARIDILTAEKWSKDDV